MSNSYRNYYFLDFKMPSCISPLIIFKRIFVNAITNITLYRKPQDSVQDGQSDMVLILSLRKISCQFGENILLWVAQKAKPQKKKKKRRERHHIWCKRRLGVDPLSIHITPYVWEPLFPSLHYPYSSPLSSYIYVLCRCSFSSISSAFFFFFV